MPTKFYYDQDLREIMLADPEFRIEISKYTKMLTDNPNLFVTQYGTYGGTDPIENGFNFVFKERRYRIAWYRIIQEIGIYVGA